MITHGHTIKRTRTRTYGCWNSMLQRCGNPKHPGHANYSKRGITVCERWKIFANFLADMGECPDGLTIERVDNTKGYEPHNCIWATRRQQAYNRSTTKLTAVVRLRVKALSAKGMSTRRIAKDVGAGKSAIQAFLAGKTYVDSTLTA